VTLQDVIDFCEGSFECRDGAPWRWADLEMTKPYQMLTVGHKGAGDDVEHKLAASMIHNMQCFKDKSGIKRPVLYWRWANKVRMEADDGAGKFMHCRFYIDGNTGRPGGNPSNPWGTPGVGQVRLAA